MDFGPIEVMACGGTFGLPTIGHKDMWQKAAKAAKKLVIVIANNPDKHPIFSTREIIEMVTAMTADLPNVEIHATRNEYLVRYAKKIGATHVFRGLRDGKDFGEEQIARGVNHFIEPGIDTEYFIPDTDKLEISSSMVLNLVGFEGWEKIVAHYVPGIVLAKLKDWHYTRQHWQAFWNAVDAQDDQTIMWNNLVSRYGEDHRAYHNLSHITHCLREFDRVKHLAKDPLALEMAIWYHDIRYDAHAKDNELRSAKFAQAAARKMGLDDEFGKRVYKMIEQTTHKPTYSTQDINLLLDIDLAIFGQPQKIYDHYEQGIREEYGWVPYDEFAAARIKILKSFLDRNAIFSDNGDFFREEYEIKARKNLKHAIKNLSQ